MTGNLIDPANARVVINNTNIYYVMPQTTSSLTSDQYSASSMATNPYTSLFTQQPVVSSNNSSNLYDLNGSLFGQQMFTGSASDPDAVAQYLQSVVDSRVAQATQNLWNKLFTSYQTKTSSLQNLEPEDVTDARQEEVDKISEKRSTQRDCAKLEADLTSGDKDKINNALGKLAKLSKAEFSAFQQYLEDKDIDLETILAAAEKIEGVEANKIDKVFDKKEKAEAWLNDEPVEKTERTEKTEPTTEAKEEAEKRMDQVLVVSNDSKDNHTPIREAIIAEIDKIFEQYKDDPEKADAVLTEFIKMLDEKQGQYGADENEKMWFIKSGNDTKDLIEHIFEIYKDEPARLMKVLNNSESTNEATGQGIKENGESGWARWGLNRELRFALVKGENGAPNIGGMVTNGQIDKMQELGIKTFEDFKALAQFVVNTETLEFDGNWKSKYQLSSANLMKAVNASTLTQAEKDEIASMLLEGDKMNKSKIQQMKEQAQA